jgi:6-phosphogluconolactonase (cycloisomerase 2 family)
MTEFARLSRRNFLWMAGVAPFVVREACAAEEHLRFAYVSSLRDGIHVFEVAGEQWRLKQVVSSSRPVSITVSPNRRFLYVVNEVDRYGDLPTGSVETFAIGMDGMLKPAGMRPLSLSATLPRHLVLSPDGRSAVVSVHGGGAYNLLDVEGDGQLGQLLGIYKEVGSGSQVEHQRAAHPQMATFDQSGRMLSSDMGSDRLNVFSLDDSGLTIRQRFTTKVGSGPKHIAMHPAGRLMCVSNEVDRTVCVYEYDLEDGRIRRCLEVLSDSVGGALAFHPSGDFLYTIGGADYAVVQVWRLDQGTGSMESVQRWGQPLRGSTAMAIDRDTLILLSNAQGLVRFSVGALDGLLERGAAVGKVRDPLSITLL